MNQEKQQGASEQSDKRGPLHKVATEVDPPSREPSDQELRDPGSATPNSKPTDNRS
jgi:hypothetical protein